MFWAYLLMFLQSLLVRYTWAAEAYPLVTKSLTAGVLAACGDVLAQTLERKPRLQLDRTVRLVTFSMLWSGPSGHYWYKALDSFWGAGLSKSLAMRKMLCDQLIMAPVGLVVFFAGMGALEGQTWTQIKQRCRKDYVSLLLPNWLLWPAVSFINFTYVPQPQRVLFVGTVAVFWNAFISFIFNRRAASASAGAVSPVEKREQAMKYT